MAALISTVDGMIMSSASLMLNDISLRLFKPNADDNHQKLVMRIMQVVFIILVINLVPIAQTYQTVIALPLHIMAAPGAREDCGQSTVTPWSSVTVMFERSTSPVLVTT